MAGTATGAHAQRQKMINLMYLIFIAMLAIQIDQEIIRSYNDTNDTLTTTRGLTEYKNDKIFEQTLAAKAQSSPDTYAAPNEMYGQLKQRADGLVQFIGTIKTEMKKEARYDERANVEDNFTALNNTEPSTNLFFVSSNENKLSPKAEDLKKKVEEFRQYINQSMGSMPEMKNVISRANANLVTEFPKGEKRIGKNWMQYKFYGQPLIAALSNLEVLQSEVRNIQSDALVMMLQEKVDADIKFNAFEAIVAAPTVILQGDQAQAKVVVGTYANSIPGLSISGVDRTANGQGFKTLATGTVGDNTFGGTISFNDANGKTISLPFSHTYRVIAGAKEVALQSGALVSADKMNVLYRGLPNPVSGSILGADNSQVTLSASGASVSGGRGKWTVTPGAGQTATLTISGTDPKGKRISQSFPFRIKNIPRPEGQIRGSNIVQMPASSIANQTVTVAMPDFDFPVSFSVNSFMFKVPGRPAIQISGNSLSSVANLTKNLRSGDICYVGNISATASGLGGQQLKQIPPVVINVQ